MLTHWSLLPVQSRRKKLEPDSPAMADPPMVVCWRRMEVRPNWPLAALGAKPPKLCPGQMVEAVLMVCSSMEIRDSLNSGKSFLT